MLSLNDMVLITVFGSVLVILVQVILVQFVWQSIGNLFAISTHYLNQGPASGFLGDASEKHNLVHPFDLSEQAYWVNGGQ